MSERRSVSQILFSYLPQQTVDVRGGIWRVEKWLGALTESRVDALSLRQELCRLARPWQLTGKDGDYVRDIENRQIGVVVKSLDHARGVELRPFPRIWFCRSCHRIYSAPDEYCRCGFKGRKGQLQFVQYCEECAEICAPWIPGCPEHQESRVKFPGTASGREIVFDCPVCLRVLRSGFGFKRSICGEVLKVNVHRSASVYTSRSVVIVNPPSPSRMQEIKEAGGEPRALAWVLGGMNQSPLSKAVTLREQLLSQGLPPANVEKMLAVSGIIEEAADEVVPVLGQFVLEQAMGEALTLAVAFSESRLTLKDLLDRDSLIPGVRQRYREKYPVALEASGLERVELLEKFPVFSGHFGYTRGSSEPGASRLAAFRDPRAGYVVYGDLIETEALYVGLSPMKVANWLKKRNFKLAEFTDPRSARISILRSLDDSGDGGNFLIREQIVTLVHSYAHRLIRLAAVHAGIERSSLSELLVPSHLGFFVYASSRSDFILGGLQAVFEGELDRLLRQVVFGEHRCALDPGCAMTGGACLACLHLGEPSCRLFNRNLQRSALYGPTGYFERQFA